MRDEIYNIVRKTIEDFNITYQHNIPVDQGENTPLYGKEGVIDSLGLVSLIVMIEENIESNLNVSLILADEKAMSQKTSPFLNVGLLVDYINSLIEEEKTEWANQSHL